MKSILGFYGLIRFGGGVGYGIFFINSEGHLCWLDVVQFLSSPLHAVAIIPSECNWGLPFPIHTHSISLLYFAMGFSFSTLFSHAIQVRYKELLYIVPYSGKFRLNFKSELDYILQWCWEKNVSRNQTLRFFFQSQTKSLLFDEVVWRKNCFGHLSHMIIQLGKCKWPWHRNDN